MLSTVMYDLSSRVIPKIITQNSGIILLEYLRLNALEKIWTMNEESNVI